MIDLSKDIIPFTYDLDGAAIPALVDLDGETKVTYYEELLAKALLVRAGQRDPEISETKPAKILPHIKHIISWLRTTDFYTAPASTKYHDSYYAGLLTHTLLAYNQLVALRSVPKFSKVVNEQWWSAVFSILVHDWCKIGRYESYLKNVKNEETGEWVQVNAYKYTEDRVGRLGHATQSLVMAMQICNTKYTSLTFEEISAIRWHMDNWDMTSYDAQDLQRCNEQIPMVRMIQFADQLAVTEY